MAAADKRKSSALARMTPNAVTIPINGTDVIVPSNKEENINMNMIMISQGRAIIQETIKKWKDMDEVPTPKQLNELLSAMKTCIESSADIYEKSEPIQTKTETVAQEQKVNGVGDINFDALTKKEGGDNDLQENPPPSG